VRQLTGLDAQFLNIESSTTTGHVGALMVLDPSTAPSGTIGVDGLRALIDSRLHLSPPLRWRLVDVPFGLDNPYWIESDDFDLEFHVREIGLPGPGTDTQLGELVARLHAHPLDRRRPLWEIYLIHGLENDRVAVYGKIHHAAIDGVSGAEMLAAFVDLTPEPREVPPPSTDWEPEREPSALAMLERGVLGALTHPVRMLKLAPRAVTHLGDLPGASRVPGVGLVAKTARTLGRATGRTRAVAPPRLPVPKTPFNGPITAHRRFAFTSVPFEDVTKIRHAHGVTVNDVVMGVCTTALRRWLIDHEALPAEPLIGAVPVSVRTEAQQGSHGNQVSMMMAPLATHLEDPAERLAAVHDAMLAAKERFNAMPASLMQDYSQLLIGALGGLASRALFKLITLGSPPFNLFVSNVPGPQFPLYIGGARIVGYYPVSAVSGATGGLNITVFSLDGRLHFGVIACREMVPDVWNMARYVREALDEMLALPGVEG